MPDTNFKPFRPDPIREPSKSIASDIFAVFPDCLIMWDTHDSTEEPELSPPHSPLTGCSQNSSPLPHTTSNVTSDITVRGDAFPGVTAPSGFESKPVQYHIHYHPLNSNRLLAAFLAGGAIALTVGFFVFKAQPQPRLDGVEPSGQDQALAQQPMG